MLIREREIKSLDLLNADVLEKVEDASQKVYEQCEKAQELKRESAGIRQQCEAIAEFIDTIFGDGTAKQLLGDGANLLTCVDTFGEIMNKIEQEKAEQTQKIQSIFSKYSPSRTRKKK